MGMFRVGMVAVFIIFILLSRQEARCSETRPAVPHYELNRADEDYSLLRDRSRRTGFWDPVKYVPLNESGSWFLSIGGEARERYEYFHNPGWGENPQDNGYLLQRFFVHGDFHMGEHFRLFGQLQSSLENGRRGGPRPSDEDQFDLHQAFLDLKLDLAGDSALTLRSGRQELAFGSQRLISVREGPNVRRSFDGFRAMYRSGDIKVDGFAAKPTQTKRYVFDDGPDHDQALWGIYSVFPLPVLPETNVDLYYLGLFRRQGRFDQASARETRHSVGTRVWRSKKPLDYNIELVFQWGSFGGDIRAWTAASDTGYTVENLPFTPRFGLKADIISGDENPDSPDLQTFNPLFPKGAYFSENSLIGPANLIDINPSIELHLTRDVTLTTNWDFFWRESIHDGIYNSSITPVRSGRDSNARYIGSQPQAQLEWSIGRHVTLIGIYAHFFAGDFLRESGAGKDVDYMTTWITYRF